jgi:type IV pilus assembly protein PilQ
MIQRILYLCLSLSIAAVAGCATAGKETSALPVESGVNTLADIRVVDNSVELKMDREFTSSYTVYKPADPYTVIVELPEVSKGSVSDRITAEGVISEVNISEVQTPEHVLRLELSLESPADVEAQKQYDGLLLVVEEEASGAAEEAEFEASEMPMAEEAAEPATEITTLTFSYSKGFLKFTLKGDGYMEPEVFALDDRIIIDVPGVEISAALPEKVISPVKAIRQGMYEDSARLVLEMEDRVEFVASTVGDSVVLSMPVEERQVVTRTEEVEAEVEEWESGEPEGESDVVPAVESGEEVPGELQAEKTKYAGKRISLDFQNADVVPIFRFLGDIGGYNVVIHPGVKGTITLKLINVPWDQALDIILEISNLDKKIDENILWIASIDVFAKQKEEAARLKGVNEKAADLVQRAIHLQYVSAAELESRLKEAKSMSPRGTSRIDERTNTLILNDIEEKLQKIIEEEVPYWDTPEHGVMQVLIEAKIVQINSEYARNLGIRWGGSADNTTFNQSDSYTVDWSVNTPVLPAGPNVAAPGGILSLGYAETLDISLSLEALETVSKVKQLSNPRILTIDKAAARIEQGTQIPFSTVSSDGTKTEFQDAVLSLDVTPEIQPNGILRLQVAATNDSPIQVGNEVGINKQQINTQALVKDGQTLVLGGIYSNNETESETRVPILGKIPFFGWLFKTQSKTVSPSEILIFITPKIVSR